MRPYFAEMLFKGLRELEEQCMPNAETIAFWIGGLSAKMQTDLIDLTPLVGTLSDSDFFDLNFLAGTLSGIVDILSFVYSVRLKQNGRNTSVDRTP